MKSPRIGIPNNLNTGGTYDLLMIKVSSPDTEAWPEGQITFGFYEVPTKITGLQKVGQHFLRLLLTSKGSDPFYPEKGTFLPNIMTGANTTEDDAILVSDIYSAVKDASIQTKAMLNVNIIDEESTLDYAEVIGVDRVVEGWFVAIKLVTLAGENASIAVPFPEFAINDILIPTPVVIIRIVPVSNFTSITSGLLATFTDISSNSPTSWAWNMGDGYTTTSRNPVHTYSSSGTYTVTLIASNADGQGTTATHPVQVVAAPISQFTFSAASPIFVGDTENFTDTSLNSPTSWAWNFGDGYTSTSQNPSHIYATAGTYSVTLTASNAGGAGTLATSVITVSVVVVAVVIDFETLGIAAPSSGTVIGTTYLSSHGVTFSALARAYHNGKSSGNVVPPSTRAGDYGFAGNATDTTIGAPGFFTMTFDSSTSYRNIILDWTGAGPFEMTLFDRSGNYVIASGNGFNYASGWTTLDLTNPFGDSRVLGSIAFSSSTRRRFFIDNIHLS